MKHKRNRSKRIFFKLYNFLICCFLLLPIFDMARIWITNMIDTKIHYDNIQIVDSSGVAIEVYEAPQPSYTLNQILLNTMYDYCRTDVPLSTFTNYILNGNGTQSWTYFSSNLSFTFTRIDFLKVYGYSTGSSSNATIFYVFINFYINWLLDITLVSFVPYVLLCISQWFMGLTEDLTSRTNKEDY